MCPTQRAHPIGRPLWSQLGGEPRLWGGEGEEVSEDGELDARLEMSKSELERCVANQAQGRRGGIQPEGAGVGSEANSKGFWASRTLPILRELCHWHIAPFSPPVSVP